MASTPAKRGGPAPRPISRAAPPSAGNRSGPRAAERVSLRLAAIGGILLLGIAAYANSLQGAFAFDDGPHIRDNQTIRHWAEILSVHAYGAHPNRYVAYLTFALNYALGGLDVTGYHATNLGIHLLNALLLFAFVKLAFCAPRLASSPLAQFSTAAGFVAAALFATHPIQTEAVTYIVQRMASLATLFYLATLVQYLRFRLARERGEWGLARSIAEYTTVLLAAILAMKTKEIAFTAPIALVLCERVLFGPLDRRKLLLLAPILATLLIIPVALINLRQPVGEVLSDVSRVTVQGTASRHDYLATELTVVATYLRLLLLPIRQNLDYDYPIRHSFADPAVIASLVLVVALLSLSGYLLWRSVRSVRRLDPAVRLVSLGIIWFFLTLGVESSFIPIADVIFEHRVYLPSVGSFTAAGVALLLAARRFWPARSAAITIVAGTAAAVILAGATFHRNRAWHDNLSLWADAVAKSPGKARPHVNLGVALARSGDARAAIAEQEAALRIEPFNPDAHTNLGAELGRLERYDEAMPHLRAAVRLDPTYALNFNNLGVALAETGNLEEAFDALSTAIRIDPSYAEAYYNLGRAYLMHRRYAEGAVLFEKAISLRPDYSDAYSNLAGAWNRLGRYRDTVALLERAGVAIRGSAEAHFNLGVAHAAIGEWPAAEGELRALEGLSPALARQLRGYLERTGTAAP